MGGNGNVGSGRAGDEILDTLVGPGRDHLISDHIENAAREWCIEAAHVMRDGTIFLVGQNPRWWRVTFVLIYIFFCLVTFFLYVLLLLHQHHSLHI